ncbi:MAG: hypothetical protein RSD13_06230 [Clostridium sp.]
MFRFNDKKEKIRNFKKELIESVKMDKKPKFRDLVSVMIAQYIIILPVVFIGMVVFFFVIQGILYLWGA